MRLVQFKTPDHGRGVGLVGEDGESLRVLRDTTRVYELALAAGRSGIGLQQLVEERVGQEEVDYAQLVSENRLLPPLDHPDPAHCYVTGTLRPR